MRIQRRKIVLGLIQSKNGSHAFRGPALTLQVKGKDGVLEPAGVAADRATLLTHAPSGDITHLVPFGSPRPAGLGERVQRLLTEGKAAQAADDPRRLSGVRDELWQLAPEVLARAAAGDGEDLEATGALVDIARPTIVLQMASGNWLQVLGACYWTTVAVANLTAGVHRDASLHRDSGSETQLWQLIREWLPGFSAAAAEAAHRLGNPAQALMIIESLTSVVAGMRMRRVAAEEVGRRMSAGGAAGADIRAYSERWVRVLQERGESTEDWVLVQLSVGDRKDPLEQFFFTSPHVTPVRAARAAGRSLLYLVPSMRSDVPGVAIRVNPDRASGRLTDSCWVPALEQSELKSRLADMRDAFAGPYTHLVAAAAAQELLDWTGTHVWGAVAAQWPDLLDGPVAVVPIGQAAMLPLYTATFRGGPACSAMDITLSPSARALYYAAIHQPATTVEAFVAADPWHGDDALPLVGEEAAEVAAVYHATPEIYASAGPWLAAPRLKGHRSASPLRTLGGLVPAEVHGMHADVGKSAAIGERMRTASVIHLACHGSLGGDTPALLLGGQPLFLHFLLRREQELERSPLVVLSACELGGFTAKLPPSEQLGFPAGLIALGARSVVGALWPLPDSPDTVALMRDFHELLTFLPSSAALPQAIEAAARQKVSPLAWGSLVHFGA